MKSNRIVVFNQLASHHKCDDVELGFSMFEELLENHHKLTFLYNILEDTGILELVSDIVVDVMDDTNSIDVMVTLHTSCNDFINMVFDACETAHKNHLCACIAIKPLTDDGLQYRVTIIDI